MPALPRPISSHISPYLAISPQDEIGEGRGAELRRYSFVAILVRLACAAFPTEAAASPARAVERLVSEHLVPHLPTLAHCDPDDFRNYKLYTPEVEDVFRKHIHPLRECYQHYGAEHDDDLAHGDRTSGGRDAISRGGDLPDAISRGGDRFCLDGWIAMLLDADLLDSCLTRQAAAHAFVSSQMLVTDEVKRRDKLLSLPFESFLEALARLTLVKPIPTASQLVASKVDTPSKFFDLLDTEDEFADWVSRNAPNYKKEETGGRSLHEVLDKLLALLLHRLDADRTGSLDTEEFKSKYEQEVLTKARSMRREQAMSRRELPSHSLV